MNRPPTPQHDRLRATEQEREVIRRWNAFDERRELYEPDVIGYIVEEKHIDQFLAIDRAALAAEAAALERYERWRSLNPPLGWGEVLQILGEIHVTHMALDGDAITFRSIFPDQIKRAEVALTAAGLMVERNGTMLTVRRPEVEVE